MLTFAAVIMFMVAGLEAMSRHPGVRGTGWWVTDAGNLVYANLVWWGVLDSDHRADSALCGYRPP